MPPRIDAVVFDFDGTLARCAIDFAAMRASVDRTIERWGLDPEALRARHVLERIAEAAGSVAAEAREGLLDACEAATREVEVEAAERSALVPGVAEALEALRAAGLGVGVITRNCREAVLAVDPGLPERVDALVARGDWGRLKPDPEHVRRCLALMGLSGRRTAIVGDHPMDMDTARAGGWLPVAVLTGAGSEAELRRAGSAHVFADAPAACAWLLAGEA